MVLVDGTYRLHLRLSSRTGSGRARASTRCWTATGSSADDVQTQLSSPAHLKLHAPPPASPQRRASSRRLRISLPFVTAPVTPKMAPSKLTDRGSPTVVPHGATVPQRASRLPSRVRFPILVALYGFINWSLLTVVTDFLGQEMGKVSRSETEDWLVVARVAYRVAILYFTWKANYDCKRQISMLRSQTNVLQGSMPALSRF